MTLAITSPPVASNTAIVANLPEPVETIEVSGLTFTKEQVEDPDFLENHGDRIAEKLAGNVYYSSYEPQNRVRDLSENAPVAEAMFEALRDGGNPRDAAIRSLAGNISGYDFYLEDICRDEARSFLRDLAEESDELEWDHSAHFDDIESDLTSQISAIVQEDDDSTPLDLLGSCDHVEIAFVFMALDCYADDFMAASHKSWPEWKELSISQGLLHALPRMGYSLEDYRKHSGNEHEEYDEYEAIPKRPPLATLDEIEEIVDNACTGYFNFAVYAQVPLVQLIELDLSRPIRLSRYSLCTLNSGSGTFMSVEKDKPVILRPEDGRFIAFNSKGPSDWCGLYNVPFQADISQ